MLLLMVSDDGENHSSNAESINWSGMHSFEVIDDHNRPEHALSSQPNTNLAGKRLPEEHEDHFAFEAYLGGGLHPIDEERGMGWNDEDDSNGDEYLSPEHWSTK